MKYDKDALKRNYRTSTVINLTLLKLLTSIYALALSEKQCDLY